MQLPEYVRRCLNLLEDAGFPAYVVGGCVRDDCLGIAPHDFDICTAALPEQTQSVFREYPQSLNGVKHGTVMVIPEHTPVEITTFRQEGGYQDNRHPDWVKFVSGVEADLSRRDYTVNAMAWSPVRGYADPFGGREDLKRNLLRAVGDPVQRYQEDSLRILRGLRFAARFGMQVDEATEAAMLSQAGLLDSLARERVFEELSRFLPDASAGLLIRFAPVLGQVIPELKAAIGFDQCSPHHAYDIFTHIAYVTEAVPRELTLRWAALLHDIGKAATFTRDENGRGHFYGHAGVGAEMADSVLLRLKAPTKLREEVVWLIAHHMTRLVPEKKLLRRYLSRYGRERVWALLALQEADMGSKGTGEDIGNDQFDRVRLLLKEIETEDSCLTLRDLAVSGNDLLALGFSGRQIGEKLEYLLEQVLDETLPNEKEALIAAVTAYL